MDISDIAIVRKDKGTRVKPTRANSERKPIPVALDRILLISVLTHRGIEWSFGKLFDCETQTGLLFCGVLTRVYATYNKGFSRIRLLQTNGISWSQTH